MNEYNPKLGCPNQNCKSYLNAGEGFVAIHDKKRNRLRCRECGKTWSANREASHFGLRTELIKVRRSIEMLRAKIPIRTIARLTKVSPSTVLRWKKKLLQ